MTTEKCLIAPQFNQRINTAYVVVKAQDFASLHKNLSYPEPMRNMDTMQQDPDKAIAFIMKDARDYKKTLQFRRLYERVP